MRSIVQNCKPSTFVLVHGAWHGSYVWNDVAKSLRKNGHTVYTPDLPGHGPNRMNFKDIKLDSYVRSIESILKIHKSRAVLVGHSMAGVIISQVAENMPQNIDKLIYLAGFVPDLGGSIVDEESKAIKPSVALEVKINQELSYIGIKHSANLRHLFYSQCNEELYDYAVSNLQDQPLQPFMDRVNLTKQKFGSVPKFYIECLRDNAISIEDQRRMYAKIKCGVITLDSDHSPFFSNPERLTESLKEIQVKHNKYLMEVKLTTHQLTSRE